MNIDLSLIESIAEAAAKKAFPAAKADHTEITLQRRHLVSLLERAGLAVATLRAIAPEANHAR